MKKSFIGFLGLVLTVSLFTLGCSGEAVQDDISLMSDGGESVSPPPPQENPPPQDPPQTLPPPTEADLLEMAHQKYANEFGLNKTTVRVAYNHWMDGVLPSQITQSKKNMNHFFQFVIEVDPHLKNYLNFVGQWSEEAHQKLEDGVQQDNANLIAQFRTRIAQIKGQAHSMQLRLAHVAEIYGVGLKVVQLASETKAKNIPFIGNVMNKVSMVLDIYDPFESLLRTTLFEDMEELLKSINLKWEVPANTRYISFLTFVVPNNDPCNPDLDGCVVEDHVKFEGIALPEVQF